MLNRKFGSNSHHLVQEVGGRNVKARASSGLRIGTASLNAKLTSNKLLKVAVCGMHQSDSNDLLVWHPQK